MLIIDIETEPAPIELLKQICKPFDPATMPPPGPFDPSTVKLGNLKDQAKINEKIEAARAAHEESAARYESDLAEAELRYWMEIQDKAALNAALGQVCAIGYRNDAGKVIIETALDASEEKLLLMFWERFQKCRNADRDIVGFNIKNFDIPFLCRRSWAYGIRVPLSVKTATGYLSPCFVDLMEVWQCGNRRDYVSLDTICRSYGLQTKPDNCTGAMFSQLLRGTVDERKAAIDYLAGDLEMTAQLAEKMGVLSAA